MGYLIVVAVSLLIGAVVYGVTLWSGREADFAFGFGGDPEGEPDGGDPPTGGPGPGYAYLRVATAGPSWRDRLQGFVGLLILLAVATAALAFGIYQVGHMINQTIEAFLDT